MANRLMDGVDSPPSLWLLAFKCTAHLLNHMVSPHLDNQVPMPVSTGVTQDLSTLLCFQWCKKVHHHEDENSFPSKTAEVSGHFVGFSQSDGCALTFAILTDDTNKITCQSKVCSAKDNKSAHLCTKDWRDDHKNERIIRSKAEQSSSDGTPSECRACVDPEELVGLQFDTPDPEDGKMKKMTIIKEIEDHKKKVQNKSAHRKFMLCGNIDD